MMVSASQGDDVVEREAIVFGWKHEQEKQQCQAWNHVFVKCVEWFLQKMSEGYDYKYEAERDKCFTYAQTDNQQCAGNQFDEGDGDAGGPERPDRKKSVGEGEKVFARVIKRA